jgi:hypothetical protein
MEAQFTFMADAYYCTFMIICTNLLIWMWVSRHCVAVRADAATEGAARC